MKSRSHASEIRNGGNPKASNPGHGCRLQGGSLFEIARPENKAQKPKEEICRSRDKSFRCSRTPGFMVLYSFIKDALLSKVGIVKVCWDEHAEESRETYYDLTETSSPLRRP
jgi:hypothetical protein